MAEVLPLSDAELKLLQALVRHEVRYGLRGFADEYETALSVTLGAVTLKVLPLARILASKEAANRPKDRLVTPVLRDALLAKQAEERTKGLEL